MTWTTPVSDADISGQTLIYQAPDSKESYVTLDFCNRSASASATISIWVVPEAESVGNEHIKESGTIIDVAGMRTATLSRTFAVPTGCKVYVQASTTSVSCQAWGDETATT